LIAGPPVAGFLIQWIGGARAVAVDAASYLLSALAIWAIRKPEPEPKPGTAAGVRGFLPEMREGLEVVFKNPILWHIAGCTSTTNLGSNMVYGAVYLIFVYKTLLLTPGEAGLVFGIGSIGFLLGALVASWMVRRLGVGPSLAINIAGGGLFILATPLAMLGAPVIVLTALSFLGFFIGAPYNITQVSLRQAITPDRVQGRMNATMRTIVWGTVPLGSFLGVATRDCPNHRVGRRHQHAGRTLDHRGTGHQA
jgi:hypothetical protein